MTDKEKSIFSKQSWWKRRSRLEKKLVLSVLVFLAAFAGFVAIVLVKYILPPKPCDTDKCLLAASKIVSSIDPTVDPCEDFFQFACGKFIEQIHGDIKATSVNALEEEVERQVAELIKEPIKKDDHPYVKTQKKIFQNCMNETEEEKEEALNYFNQTIINLHGWPVVEGFNWNEQLFDWKETIYKLRAAGYPYEIFFDVTVSTDLKNKTRNAVYISEPFVTRVKKEHIYREDRLEKLIEKHSFNTENETENSYKAHLLSTRFTVEEFQKNFTEINWLSFINNILKPAAKISKTDYVFFNNDGLLREILALLEKTPRRIQANYIIWSVVDQVITYLSKEMQEIENKYLCLISRTPPSKNKFKYCKRIINRSFRPSPVYINYARKYLPKEKKDKVTEMLHRVKLEFVQLLRDATWMDPESTEKALEKAESITEIIGTPGDYLDDGIYNTFGNDDIEELNFLHVLLIHMRYQNDFSFSQLNQLNDDSTKDITYHWVIATVNAMYSPLDNAMILPVAILQGIFYDPDRPQYLNYGSLGSIIGHELTHGFCKEASQYDKHGNENAKMWTNKTSEAFEEKVQCIIKDAEEFDVVDTESTINGTQTLEENIADYTGIKVAYAAYKNWVREHGEEPKLTGLDYTPYQLFWIASISHECYVLSGKSLETSLKHDSHALNVFRAISPIKNSFDFAKDFNCPLNSKMNPQEKCQIF
ncbi:hypothetical protein FQR65_LT06861 [Abscondita terminalis]|nr:hypothetical protein FQR65_LT06861 [Abscondita terminalis]